MRPLEKGNMGRGDYMIYRVDGRTPDALYAELLEVSQAPDLMFPLFVHLGRDVAIDFLSKEQLDYFLNGLSIGLSDKVPGAL